MGPADTETLLREVERLTRLRDQYREQWEKGQESRRIMAAVLRKLSTTDMHKELGVWRWFSIGHVQEMAAKALEDAGEVEGPADAA